MHDILFVNGSDIMHKNGDYLKNLYKNLKRDMKEKKIKHLLSPETISKINYSPNYQRNYIWSDTKAIKLIETVLINSEVPPLTVVVSNDIFEIIDGRQRFETLLRFYNDEFPLRAFALNKLKDLDGCYYSDLPPNVKLIFEEYKIKMITYTVERGIQFEKEDLEIIKRDLFRKYNYGMTALSKSEIARAKYLYDDLTEYIRKTFIDDKTFYDNCVSTFLPISKRGYNDREKRNLLLMNARELLTLPYIPIIGVKTVRTGTSVIETYYENFVKKENILDKKDEFIKISKKIFAVKKELQKRESPLQENLLFLKCVYWMLSILYKVYPTSFYDFQITRFCHYIENRGNALEYFNNYKNISSTHIINRHTYVANYISAELHLDVDQYLESLIENRKKVVFKPKTKIKSDENWNGIGSNEQLLPIPAVFTIKEIIEHIKNNRFIVRTNYQRTEVRSIDKASKIIESMILGVKLPPIYVTVKQTEANVKIYTVIDGQQRLISILRYMNEPITDENYDFVNTYKKNYALTGLKDLTALEGMTYEGKNPLGDQYKELLENYEIDAIEIHEQANRNFDPVDMFLRLNENPCTIGKNTFEMWNSYDIVKVIDKIKNIAKYDLFKQDGNMMKEEELVTVLAYMEKEKITLENCKDFFKVHLYTENRDKTNERIEAKFSISNKGEITRFLELMSPETKEEEQFLTCLDQVSAFIEKLKILSDNDSQKLIEIFNPYLDIPRRGSMKDFYIVWMIFRSLDNHIVKTYREEILEELKNTFQLMKKMPKDKDIDFFLDHIRFIRDKYSRYMANV